MTANVHLKYFVHLNFLFIKDKRESIMVSTKSSTTGFTIDNNNKEMFLEQQISILK